MEFQQRLKTLQEKLSKKEFGGVLITASPDLYYLTGKNMSSGKLLVFQEEAFLLVDSRYIEECQQIKHLIVKLEKGDLFSKLLSTHVKGSPFAFDSQATTYEAFLTLKKKLENDPSLSLEPWSQPLASIRMVKEPEEIDRMKAAAELGSKGFDFVCHSLKEGVTEEELACKLQEFWWRNRSQGASFDPIIAFGKSSSMPHYHVGPIPLEKGHVVLVDLGVKLDDYCSDMTRTLFFGEVNQKMLEIYKIVQQAQMAACNACRPGISARALDEVARSYITSKGYGDYFGHALGHGIGLEVHEGIGIGPKTSEEHVLEEGMALTIEPGIYVPNEGGVRIEDTVIITSKGCEAITCRPKEPTFFA